MVKKKRLVSDSVTLFVRVTWLVCFVVGSMVLYSAFRREEQAYNRLFAEQEKKFEFKAVHVACSPKYLRDISNYPGCKPKKCGRYVMDNVVTSNEVDVMLNLVRRGLSFGGSSGGASILDLHTGAMSKGVHFVNLYKLQSPDKLFKVSELQVYKKVREKIQNALASKFGILPNKVYLTKPTFFSRLTNKPPLSGNDEYWHPHIDKETYPSFHYTTLLYLNDYGIDFNGGQFNFLEKGNSTSAVQPKKGRVLLFTSGHENMHFVERVTHGVRFAITISFTCDPKEAIPDPSTKLR
ncbi:2-oxoglutarate and iron-dependent oxygenase domain-containing protein 3-like [Planococcus citri]|uniref:2-oxoglutarate and iron-dependent oxygenase domain-containing protein 3-like n=1 Tax=Planococcus citri TaxID=170843 RepID=UPI0031F78A9A